MFRTEHPFTLPLGYVDADGTVHREGTMRLATAADEIHPLRDQRVLQNEAYLIVIILSRVITTLGSLGQVNPKVIEGLYAADLAHLQDLYNSVNQPEGTDRKVMCPQCEHNFVMAANGPGGS